MRFINQDKVAYQSPPLKPEIVSSLRHSEKSVKLIQPLCVCVCVSVFPVQKPEKLSSACVAGALRDGVCAYTALHTHARIAAGHTLLVTDGASVCINTTELDVLVTFV